MQDIDFVVTWVDGDDPAWRAEKRKWENSGALAALSDVDANADCRYRDGGLLKYWFRAVERFAPWVNKVFFVTCGQKPEWLDESCPRLRLVNHADYIPCQYLPTFHSNTIELNLHRIGELSEKFVLFNDDVFLLKPVSREFFFKGEAPVIPCDLGVPRWLGSSNTSRMALNNCGALKACLDVEGLIKKNIWKFANIRALGLSRAMKNVAAFAVNRAFIPGTFGHLACSHLKSTFEEAWRAIPHAFERTSQSRFRSDDSINHWLLSAWNMVKGNFYPANEKSRGRFYNLGIDSLESITSAVRRQSCYQICINDKGTNTDTERSFKELANAFDAILPQKSAFEK